MGSTETWFYVNNIGQLIRHVENDGWRMVKKGLEPHEAPMDIEAALQQYPGHREEIRVELEKYKAKEKHNGSK